MVRTRTDVAVAATEPQDEAGTDVAIDPPDGPAGLNALAAAALGEDPKAVRRFLVAITPAIRRACCGVMGRGHADLEDTIQDALVDTMRALPSYRFEGNVVHYVTRIAMRLAIDARRRGTVRSGRFRALAGPEVEAQRQGNRDSDRFEQAELVRHMLQDLKPAQADVLILHLVLGFSVDEVAVITHAGVNSVKKRLHEGRGALKRQLERLGHAPARRKVPGR